MSSKRKSRILKLLSEKNGKSLSKENILLGLNLPGRKRQSLHTILESMVIEGTVKKTSKGRYRLRRHEKKHVGKDRRYQSSSGFHLNGNSKNIDQSNFSDGKSIRILADLKKTPRGFVACPRRTEIPEYKIENGRRGKGFSDGELVVIKIELGKASAKVAERLGISGEVEAEKKGIISEYCLSKGFSREVREEVRSLSSGFSDVDLPARVNLEKETIFTIDGDDAKDFDDAVGIKKIRKGYKLWVNIADVSHYVAYGSACDKEATRRATSTYLSDRVVPMLPKKLSNDLCSLRPRKRRLTKTVEMDFDSSGDLKKSRIYNSFIKSCVRLTYSEVASVLKTNGTISSSLGKKVISSLFLMKELYGKLKDIRIKKGGLDFDFPEAVLLRDSTGNVTGVDRFRRNVAHEIIEEFMIMANSVVAEFIFKNGFESIYRIHEPPDLDSIEKLRKSLLKTGLKADIGANVKQLEIQEIMKTASGRKDWEQINFMILRALKKAVYSTKHVPHFGLAIDDYTHFTSPIRRYSDIVVHRIIDNILEKKDPFYNSTLLKRIAERCSILERTAEYAERQFMNLETANFMKSNIDEIFHGKILSIHPFGVFIEIKEHFVEGLIPEHFYKSRGKKRKWFELGEEVRVKLVSADIEKRRLTFDLVY